MLRLFILLSFIFYDLLAFQDGFTLCINKVKDSNSIQNASLSIPIKKTKRIVYTQAIPNYKILKYDPFLSLYLVEDKKSFAYPFTISKSLHHKTAALNTVEAREGKFLSQQIGLDKFASYSEKIPGIYIITSDCCSLEGVHTTKGIIQNAYLRHFAKTKKAVYGGIGIRVEEKEKSVIVSAVDPFFKDNPFEVGDNITAFDDKKVLNAATFMQKVLFSKIGVMHKVQIKRNNLIYTFIIQTNKRYGGGYLSDTFMERKGLYFDENMHIVRVTKKFKELGLIRGDKLLQINGVKITNQESLCKYLQKYRSYDRMLFQRNNFDFFVNIK